MLTALALMSSCALAESYVAAVTQKSAPVYSDAKMLHDIGELAGYSVVKVEAENGNVAKVRYNGSTLYMNKSALTNIEDFAIPGKFTAATFVFQEPDISSSSMPVKAGTLVNVLAVAGNWALVERDGYAGYTYKGDLVPAAAEDDNANDPFLPQETPDNTIPAKNEVTIETIAAVVSVPSLPVYQSASTSSKKIGTLKSGQNVTIYAYNNLWAYVGLGGNYGFCALSALRTTGAVIVNPDEEINDVVSTPVSVTADAMVVYKSASTSSKKLGTLNKGAVVNLIKASKNWAYIELNGSYGYCALVALSTSSSQKVIGGKTAKGTCTVIRTGAKVYASKSKSAKSTSVKIGTTYSFFDYDTSWVTVGLSDTAFGYIPISSLSAKSYAELKNEDSGSAVKTLETALLSLGYFDGVPGTNYSSATVAAVKRLQAACGITQTGVADVATLRVLYSGNVPKAPILNVSLSKGSKSDNVTRLQTRLFELDYLSRESSIDGDYGSTTSAAISLFQKACGLSATGSADSKTIAALYNPSAPALSASQTAPDETSIIGTADDGAKISIIADQPSGNSTSISSKLASTTSSYSSGMSNKQKLEYVIYNAQKQLGKRYVYGSAGTSTFDCSGLTLYCFGKIGISMPHSAYSQGYNNNYTKISGTSGLRRGDCVFFNTVSDGDMCDHVGISLGNNYFIHASSGAGKVVVSSLGSGYYNRVFSWGRRILA